MLSYLQVFQVFFIDGMDGVTCGGDMNAFVGAGEDFLAKGITG